MSVHPCVFVTRQHQVQSNGSKAFLSLMLYRYPPGGGQLEKFPTGINKYIAVTGTVISSAEIIHYLISIFTGTTLNTLSVIFVIYYK